MCSLAGRLEPQPFTGRAGILQRVLPAYRAGFFNLLGEHCRGGLGLFAGAPLNKEQIPALSELSGALVYPARNIHFLDPSSKAYFCWQTDVIAWLETWDPDVLVVEANPRYLSTPAAADWMHKRARPVLGWGLGAPEPRGVLATLQEPGRKAFLNKLDGVISYSSQGAHEYSRYFSKDRIFVAPNAVQRRPVQDDPPLRSSSGEMILLFVGRLQERKRLDLLIQACASLAPEIRPALWIVGDGPARSALEALAGRVYPATRFWGAKRGPELSELFSQAHLFVLPGTGGLAVQEALTYGLPVIVAEGDGTQEDLVRPENGWLVPAGELTALVDALEKALGDPARLQRMGAESYRIARQEVNLERMVQVFISAFHEVRQSHRE